MQILQDATWSDDNRIVRGGAEKCDRDVDLKKKEQICANGGSDDGCWAGTTMLFLSVLVVVGSSGKSQPTCDEKTGRLACLLCSRPCVTLVGNDVCGSAQAPKLSARPLALRQKPLGLKNPRVRANR